MKIFRPTPRHRRSPIALLAAVIVLAACGVNIEAQEAPSQESVIEDGTLPPVPDDRLVLVSDSMISGSATATRRADRVGLPVTPLSGRMIGANGSSLVGLDLASGRYRTLDGNPELAEIGLARRDATVVTRRDRGVGSGAVLTVDDCLEDLDDVVCVLFTDRDGNVNPGDFFSLRAESPGPAKTSFDGERVIMELTDRRAAASVITVFTRDGDVIAEYEQSGGAGRRGHYDFLPDGRVIYGLEGNELLGDGQPTGFAIADPDGQIPTRRFVLPDFYQGLSYLRTIETSPDGSEVLMTVEPEVGPTRPIIVDMETLGITQLIDREDGGVTSVRQAVWGPDGKWVYAVIPSSRLLSGPGLTGGTVVFIGTSLSLFAYEANGETHSMPVEPSDLSDSVRLIPTESNSDRGGPIGGGAYSGDLVWIP